MLEASQEKNATLSSRVEDLKSTITYLRKTVTALAVALGVAATAFIVFLIAVDLSMLM